MNYQINMINSFLLNILKFLDNNIKFIQLDQYNFLVKRIVYSEYN